MISENKFNKRLDEKHIVIKEYYEKSLAGIKKTYVKSTNGENECNIINCSLLKKEYYLNGKKIGITCGYNENIKYLYAFLDENGVMKCPNCGNVGSIKEFSDCCPYCRTNFNIDYKESKIYNDIILKNFGKFSKNFSKIFMILFSIFMTALNFKKNGILEDSLVSTIFAYSFGFVICLFLGYLISSVIVFLLLPIVLYNEQRQINLYYIWDWIKKRGYKIDVPKFYNDLNYHLKNYYFDDKNLQYKDLINFDILEYKNVKYKIKNGKMCIRIKVKMREIYLKNDKILKKVFIRTIEMSKNENYIGHTLFNKSIQCKNCGNSISIIDDECEYCGTKINYINEWILDIK